MSSDFLMAMAAVFIGVPLVFATWTAILFLMVRLGAFDE